MAWCSEAGEVEVVVAALAQLASGKQASKAHELGGSRTEGQTTDDSSASGCLLIKAARPSSNVAGELDLASARAAGCWCCCRYSQRARAPGRCARLVGGRGCWGGARAESCWARDG